MNETLRVLKERRSVRRYKAEQITEAELNAVLEAGTWAPSAKGLQTSVLVVVQDPETIAYMSRLNAEIQGNPGTDPFYGAPTLLVVLAGLDGIQLEYRPFPRLQGYAERIEGHELCRHAQSPPCHGREIF